MEGRRAEAAITVIGAGLAVIGAVFYILGVVEAPEEEAIPVKAGSETVLSVDTTPTTVADPVEIAQLSGTIADVLAENGYTEVVGESALKADLSDSIVEVLIANEAVLRVADESSATEDDAK